MPTKPKNISLSEFLEIGRQRGATDGLGDLVCFLAEQGRDEVRAEGYRSGNVWVECAPVWWRHVDWEATNADSSPAPYRVWGGGIDDLWPAMSTESHSTSTASSNVVYFELKWTEPPTPRRVERIELPQAAIDLVWPVVPEAPKSQRRRWTAPRYPEDEGLVQEGVSMVNNGNAGSAREAARRLAPQARGNSVAAKETRLRKKIGLALNDTKDRAKIEPTNSQ